MTKKKTMKNIKTPNKFPEGGVSTPDSALELLSKLTAAPTLKTEGIQLAPVNTQVPKNSINISPNIKNAAGLLGGLAGGLISDGFSTTGGQVLSGIGDAAMMFNPFIGGAIKLASGLVNKGFGTKWDQAGIAEAESNIQGLNTFQSGASDYDALAQDFNRIGSMNKTVKASDLGKDGWFVNRTQTKANKLNTDLGNAYNYAMRNVNNVADNISNNTLANLERNYAAFGGPLFAYGGQTHGADFTNGLTFINNGGTHESNPYEGVPISMDQEGNPNLVEEGEVIWNDYVFSNRLKVPKGIKTKYKLRGNKPITFAEAVDKLSKESEERPNDPISMRGLESILMNMAMEQETLKSKKQSKNTNGNKFATGGPYTPYSYISGYNNGWFGNDGKYTKEYLDYVNGITKEQMLKAFNDNFSYYSDDKNKGTDRYKAIEAFYKSNPTYAKQLSELSDDMFNTSKGLMIDNKPGYMHHVAATMMNKATPIPITTPEGLTTPPILNTDLFKSEKLNRERVTIPSNAYEKLPTWMRYAPAVGFGALALSDALGITNKPDYSNADAVIKAVRDKATYDPIRFKPIGDYLAYNPFDTEYHANQLRAVAGANRRHIMNTSGGNRATAMAGILASDNNTMNQLGDLYRKASEYNLEQRQKVADFNRSTNITNSEGFYKADAANQSAALQARGLGLEGLMKGYTMREQAKLMSDQARAANISGLFTNLGNIGYDNANRNMANWSIANGTWAPSQWAYDPFTGKPIKSN